ncbi:MAG: hypothetical protein WC774_05980 [Candidatus Gracilibacteria bacterium]
MLFVVSTPQVYAQSNAIFPFRGEDRVVLDTNEIVERDFFAAGDRVDIKGTVRGDLYVAGSTVNIDGVIEGDVLTAGGEIDINGKVNGNIRAVGGNITISGTVGKNITVGGGNVVLDNKAQVLGSIVVGAGNFTNQGTVAGNIVGGIGNMVVSNKIGGNIYAGVGKMELEKGASVSGNILYYSNEEAFIGSEATVAGTVERRIPPVENRQKQIQTSRAASNGFRVFSMVSALIIGLLFIKFFPGILEKSSSTIDRKPWHAFGFGLLSLIVTPILAIILFVTLFGFPIGIFLIFIYIVELYAATYIVSYWIGRLILTKTSKKTNPYLYFLIGTIVYFLIISIPGISGLIRFLTVLIGLGTIVLMKYGWYQKTFGTRGSTTQ